MEHKVYIQDISKENIQNVIDNALDSSSLSFSGKKVLIKPNILGPFPSEKGVTTHPMVISAIVDGLIKRGAIIIVGDNPGSLYAKIEQIGKITGLGPASKGYLRSISDSEWIHLEKINENIPISKAVLDADIIINVPRFKTHGLTGITCAIKNMFGIIPGGKKAYLHTVAPNRKEFASLLVDVYKIRPPDFTIVDGTTAMEGVGPSHGNLRPLNKLIWGTDPIAIDSVVSQMMGIPPDLIDTTVLGHRAGLGEIDPKKIGVNGNFLVIPNFRFPSRIATLIPEKFSKFFNFGTLKPKLIREKCIKCGNCKEVCPKEAIVLNPYPQIARDRCISCYSCIEHCPVGALTLPTVFEDIIKELRYRLFR